MDMDMVVVGEFSCGYPIHPVVQVIVPQQQEVFFQFLIDMLHLSVSLWRIDCQGVVLDLKLSVEVCHELWV